MSKSVAVQLYRRALRLVALAENTPNMTKMAEARWAEYIPAGIHIEPREPMHSVLRRSFERPSTFAESVADGFTFIREAAASMLALEILSLWDDILSPSLAETQERLSPCDLTRGLALISASLSLAVEQVEGVPASPRLVDGVRAGRVEACAKTYEARLRSLVEQPVSSPSQGGERADTEHHTLRATVADLNRYIEKMKGHHACRRNEGQPENFTLISLFGTSEAAECVLNVLLLLHLNHHHHKTLSCSLVGSDFVFPWVRIDRRDPSGGGRKGDAVFASWSYGAMTKTDVERRIHTTDKQWSRRRERAEYEEDRRHILVMLLNRQLVALSAGEARTGSRYSLATSLCKEQLIHLL